jgi:hypothetical protein
VQHIYQSHLLNDGFVDLDGSWDGLLLLSPFRWVAGLLIMFDDERTQRTHTTGKDLQFIGQDQNHTQNHVKADLNRYFSTKNILRM